MDSELFEKIYAKVLNFVAYMPRTEKEVRDKLGRICSSPKYKNILSSEDGALVEGKIIESLKELKLLNDSEYAQTYVSGFLSSSKKKSISQIKTFLYKKGVSKEIIEEAITALGDDFDFETALATARKKVRNLALLTSPEERKKLALFLMRKGYSSNLCYRVVDSLAGLK